MYRRIARVGVGKERRVRTLNEAGEIKRNDRLLVGAGDSVEDLGACVACLVGIAFLGKVRDDVAQAVREEEDLVEDTDGLRTNTTGA